MVNEIKTMSEELQDYEKIAVIEQIVKNYVGKKDSLITVLHAAQNVYGYLPIEVQKIIATGLDIPLSEVSSVVSFYSFFSVIERGKHTIRVCLGTACYVRGGKKLVEAIYDQLGIGIGETTEDKNFSFEVARCIGACGLAPAVMIDDEVYKQVTPEKLEKILDKYR